MRISYIYCIISSTQHTAEIAVPATPTAVTCRISHATCLRAVAGDLPASRRGRPVPVHISAQYGPWRRGGRENEGAFHCRWIVMSSSPLSTQEYEEAVLKAAQDVGLWALCGDPRWTPSWWGPYQPTIYSLIFHTSSLLHVYSTNTRFKSTRKTTFYHD